MKMALLVEPVRFAVAQANQAVAAVAEDYSAVAAVAAVLLEP
jgi:hypothetical protein